jgi:hypothetical protein
MYILQKSDLTGIKIMQLVLTVLLMNCLSKLSAQTLATQGDCLGATMVCQESYSYDSALVGSGNFPEEILVGNAYCLTTGERNNSWFLVNIQESGLFGFNVIPQVSNQDYDWAVFDLSNNTFADIALGIAPAIGCNYASNIFPLPITGMNNGINPQDEAMVFVDSGAVLAICVNNFSNLGVEGFTIQFNIPGATANVIDTSAPLYSFDGAALSQGDTLLAINFSEFVTCASVGIEDFTIIDPLGDTLQIDSISGGYCSAGGYFEKNYFINLHDSLWVEGSYAVYVSGEFEDLCGNPAPGAETFSFTIGTPTGIQTKQARDFMLFPNPSSEYLTLIFSEKLKSFNPSDLRIVDITGRMVAFQAISANSMQEGMYIPVQNLPAGLYRVVLNTSGNTYSKPFVKL